MERVQNNLPQGRLGGSVVEHPTSAQVMISQFVSLRPVSGSVLTAQLWILCLPLSLPLPCLHTLSLSKIKKH